MPRPIRVIDTGLRGGRENVAFDQALIEARNAARSPETVRFLRFRPCALVGLHQMLSHEVRLDYCARHGIEVGRRITGGGGLYLDEGQIGWELALACAGAHPERVRGVIAMSPHLFVEARTLDAIRGQIADFERGDLKARLRRHHGAGTDALFERLVRVWTGEGAGKSWGLEPHVARVRCPVLAIQGEDDEFFSAEQLQALAALIPGRLETLRIPGCGHYPLHQARNEVLAAAIRFIRAATASGTRIPRAPAGA